MCGDTMARWRWKTKEDLLIFPLGIKTELKPLKQLSRSPTRMARVCTFVRNVNDDALKLYSQHRRPIAVCARRSSVGFLFGQRMTTACWEHVLRRTVLLTSSDDDDALQIRLAIRNSICIVLAISRRVCVLCVWIVASLWKHRFVDLVYDAAVRDSVIRRDVRFDAVVTVYWVSGYGLWESRGEDITQCEWSVYETGR